MRLKPTFYRRAPRKWRGGPAEGPHGVVAWGGPAIVAVLWTFLSQWQGNPTLIFRLDVLLGVDQWPSGAGRKALTGEQE